MIYRAASLLLTIAIVRAVIYKKPSDKNSKFQIVLALICAMCSILCATLPSLEQFVGPVEDKDAAYLLAGLFLAAALVCAMAYYGERLEVTDDSIIYRNWLFRTKAISKSEISSFTIRPNGDIKIYTKGQAVLIGKTTGHYKDLLLFLADIEEPSGSM